MYVIIRHFILSISTAINLSKAQGVFSFFRIFYIRFFYAFSFIRNFVNSNNSKVKNITSSNYFIKNIKSTKVINDLNKFGYNDFLKVKNSYLNNIKKEITLNNASISFKGDKKTKGFLKELNSRDNLNSLLSKSKKNKISHVVLNIDISKTKYIKSLATSNFFMNIARDYINSDKISVSGQCYISNPSKITEAEKKDNAQYFHYDNDFKKFFKIFIYLNDVSSLAGPHSFIVSTNKNKKFRHIVADRIEDAEIERNYNLNNIKIFNGKKGQVIIEDTFGLHKGNLPIKKSRLMIILIYGHGFGINIYKNSILKKFQ